MVDRREVPDRRIPEYRHWIAVIFAIGVAWGTMNKVLDHKVDKSVYEYVVYDSDVEREFARKLNDREDIKLFVKLPAWFEIDTPIGKYNPDWAILRHDDTVLYLVRETKSTKNFEKLRGTESQKVRCGRKHFDSLGVDFAVVTSASEIA